MNLKSPTGYMQLGKERASQSEMLRSQTFTGDFGSITSAPVVRFEGKGYPSNQRAQECCKNHTTQ